MHMIMWVMSDRAIPRSFRFMEGFGVHTFRLVNAKNESTFVKFHWKPKLGLQSVMWNEAVKINGADPDFHRRDLWTAIQSGNFPQWELQLQLFDQAFADQFEFDILDPTKLIPEELVPPIPVGRLVLDRMPDNFFAETEQVAFMTQNVPRGIDFSNDPLLQGRNFSYLDTQLKRLGSPNFTHIPINAPKCPFHHFQQDGQMAMRNPGRPRQLSAELVRRGPAGIAWPGFRPVCRHRAGPQAAAARGKFCRPLQPGAAILHQPDEGRTASHRGGIDLRTEQGENARDPRAHGVASVEHRRGIGRQGRSALGLKVMPKPANAAMPTRQDLEASPALSIIEKGPQRFEGRKLGILVTDGVDAGLLNALKAALEKGGATFEIVAPKIGGAKASDGSWIVADEMIDGAPSVLYDAVALLPAPAGIDDLLAESTARDFVADAFAHCKFIGYVEAAKPLFEKAGVSSDLDEGCIPIEAVKDVSAFVGTLGKLRLWSREPNVKAK